MRFVAMNVSVHMDTCISDFDASVVTFLLMLSLTHRVNGP